ncbi:primase homolog protein isoform X2 [Diospyros lotus]|uniref:primase homolog protein isoform X2 n=1 Tax=Diospyros lotus TaxID=55363 RepID=UPI0022527B7B|nr:primase homolog protein isoform X2 [Diospyros lotus]
MTLHRLGCPLHHALASSRPLSICDCIYTVATRKAASIIPISNRSRLHRFQAYPLFVLTSSSKLTSKFHSLLLYSCGFRSNSDAKISRTPVAVGRYGEQEATNMSKLRALKQKAEVLGIDYDSCTPGMYDLLICPKCNGGQSMQRSLSVHISMKRYFAMWRCFHVECGWAGQAFADNDTVYNGVNKIGKGNLHGQMTVESLGLVPLGEKLIAYFAERMISKDILLRNAVMQISSDQNVIAFTYRRNGVLVSCKYRSLDKKFWQEKGTEKILYGLDDIKESGEIIIVEGEIDKLSMEEAGFRNCVSVPDGAPQKVSTKELPSLEKDSRFQYLWNCKGYLDKVSKIILATDGDTPGQALAEELARRLGMERCWRVSWPKKDKFSCFKDANEVLKNLGPQALRDIVDKAELY